MSHPWERSFRRRLSSERIAHLILAAHTKCMTNDIDVFGESPDPAVWGKNWIEERLKLVDEDAWLSTEQRLALLKNVNHLVDLLGAINVARIVHCTGWSTLFPAISWHVEAVAAIGKSRGGLEFIERVKGGTTQDSASILELAWRFVSVGAKVEVEPTVEKEGVAKKPDLALLGSSGECICLVEAAANADSIDQSMSDGFRRMIQPILFRNGFMKVIAGDFFRVLSDDEIVAFEMNLKRAIEGMTLSPDRRRKDRRGSARRRGRENIRSVDAPSHPAGSSPLIFPPS
jgi:hypothetical protein